MKISKKRTCNDCVAFNSKRCELGYKVERVYHSPGLAMGAKPKEPCPKPKTIKDYFYARENHTRY